MPREVHTTLSPAQYEDTRDAISIASEIQQGRLPEADRIPGHYSYRHRATTPYVRIVDLLPSEIQVREIDTAVEPNGQVVKITHVRPS